jgi:hypothetical protein
MACTSGPMASSSELEGFLLSEVGIQPNGMPLTVLSLFARMGLDPWSEAERLSTLPNESAVSWVAAAISRAPSYSLKQSDAATLASHLVDRLPAYSRDQPFETFGSTELGAAPVWTLMVVFYAVIGVFLSFLRST